MRRVSIVGLRQEEKVRAYFQSHSSYWKDIYSGRDVYAEIHRNRHAVVLNWIDNLALAPGSHFKVLPLEPAHTVPQTASAQGRSASPVAGSHFKVLEIGCGAGLMAVALAQRGHEVHAIDSSEAMVQQARGHALKANVANLLSVNLGETTALAFEDASFDLVTAMGVIPWLEQPELAIREMARVTKPGGYVILTADNRARLNHLLDPWFSPVLTPLKRHIKATFERIGVPHHVGATFHSRRFIDKALAKAELIKTKGMTLGFGPFTLMRFPILPKSLGIALNHWLQHLADRNVPVFRSTGAQYLVMAWKPGSPLDVQSIDDEKSVSRLEVSYDQEMEVHL